jgi:Na+-translocating ferredoxin:NAD+ oxidoreductase RnfD subunit
MALFVQGDTPFLQQNIELSHYRITLNHFFAVLPTLTKRFQFFNTPVSYDTYFSKFGRNKISLIVISFVRNTRAHRIIDEALRPLVILLAVTLPFYRTFFMFLIVVFYFVYIRAYNFIVESQI